ncbi:hypothetical protein C1646_752240 [Rhizophagus diaphanus]|nr:hypothetical protein C1646_752240 [Rhizophagus diaphanus] [Rhizophagus sp. MUCL 43196]
MKIMDSGTAEEHEELDNLNNGFSNRLDDVNQKSSLPIGKGKKKEIREQEQEKEVDKINKNKKRVMATQGRKEDSDRE